MRDRVRSDHVTRAHAPTDKINSNAELSGPQEVVVLLDYEGTGLGFVWKKFIGHNQDEESNL